MEMCPEARFTMAEGIKNGEILPGPPWRNLPCSRSIMSNPPMPEDTYTPVVSASSGEGCQPDMRTAKSAAGLFLCLGMLLDVLDGVLDRSDLLGVLIGNLDSKRLFKGHDELDGIERVRSQVVHERSGGGHFALVHPELFHDDLLDAFFGASHSSSSALNFSQPFSAVPPSATAIISKREPAHSIQA